MEASPALFHEIGFDESLSMIEEAAALWPFPLSAWRVREHRAVIRNLLLRTEREQQIRRAAVQLWHHGLCRDGLAKLTFEAVAGIAKLSPSPTAHHAFLQAIDPRFDGVNWADLCKAGISGAPIEDLKTAALSPDELRAALDFAIATTGLSPTIPEFRALTPQAVRAETAAFAKLVSGAELPQIEAESDFLALLQQGGAVLAVAQAGSPAALLTDEAFCTAVARLSTALSPENFERQLGLLWTAGVRADQLVKLLDQLHIRMRADPDNPRWDVIFNVIRHHCSRAERTLAAVELAAGGARRDRIALAVKLAPEPLSDRMRNRLWEYAVAAHDEAPSLVRQMIGSGIPASTCPGIALSILNLRGDAATLRLIETGSP